MKSDRIKNWPKEERPREKLLAEPLFLTRHIEKTETGILDMIGLCKANKLRPPEFRQEMGQFIQTLWLPISLSAPALKAHDAIPEAIAWTEQRILEASRSEPQTAPGPLAASGYAIRTGNFKRGLAGLSSELYERMGECTALDTAIRKNLEALGYGE